MGPISFLVATLSVFVASVSSHKILFLMPLATKSETHLLNPIAEALLQRGHDVTLVTPSSSSIKHRNFTEIVPVKSLDIGDFEPESGTVLDVRKTKDDIGLYLFSDYSHIVKMCEDVYQNKDFATQVLEADSYDIVLTSAFFSECFLGLIHKFKAPYVMISSMPVLKDTMEMSGLRMPLSFVPTPLYDLTDKMTLYERIVNVVVSYGFSMNNHHMFKMHEMIYKRYVGNDLPGVYELRKQVSMIFSNTHFITNSPVPTMPDMVEIGGVHCRPPKPLSKDLDDFLSEGENGFIFFSLGTVFREETMPKSLMQIFINVFSRLKVRVLWKWKGEIQGLPKHILVKPWLSQQDILGHPKIRLFISHGGLLSIQEATYHSVPILGIPLFADQDGNMRRAVNRGMAIKLELLTLTEQVLEDAIKKMLTDKSFAENAKINSAMFRDQPQTPLERAVYYLEYLIRFKGAPQLRSHARNLSYWEYYLYDVQLILLAIAGAILFFVWTVISICLRIFGSKEISRTKMKFKKND